MNQKKLVRDKIPNLIKSKGKKIRTHIADDQEYWQEVKLKLIEEVEEFIESENQEEIADILEVIEAICKFKNFKKEKIEKFKIKKASERGGFEKRIVLDEVYD